MPRTVLPETEIGGDASSDALLAFVVAILQPLTLLLLRQGMTAYEFIEIVRWVFARTAMDRRHFGVRNRDAWRLTKSRAAVLTGFTRREVDRLVSAKRPAVGRAREAYHRLARILRAWTTEQEFLDATGQPRDLPVRGESVSFEQLARRAGRDVPVRALLDEAIDRGCVILPRRGIARFVHANIDQPLLPAEQIDQLAAIAGDFMTLLCSRLRGDGGGEFVAFEAGRVAGEYRRELAEHLAEAVKAFSTNLRRELAAQPRPLLDDDAPRLLGGIYAGFL